MESKGQNKLTASLKVCKGSEGAPIWDRPLSWHRLHPVGGVGLDGQNDSKLIENTRKSSIILIAYHIYYIIMYIFNIVITA